MRSNFAAGSISMAILVLSSLVIAGEVPIYVAKGEDQQHVQDTSQNIAVLERLIADNGSVVVWVTLDPVHVDFSPGLTVEMSAQEEREQDKRVSRALLRIFSPLIAARTVSKIKRAESQFGHAGLIRIEHRSALQEILADPSVVMITRATL